MNRAWGLRAATGDFNGDQYPDIYVANDFIKPDNLCINQKFLLVAHAEAILYQHQELTIAKGDSIFLSDAFQTKAGIYREYQKEQYGQDSLLLITQLNLKENNPSIETGIDFHLHPNPFTDAASLTYQIAEATPIELALFHLNAKRLKTLVNEQQDAGIHTYNLKDFPYTAGLYFFRLRTNAETHFIKAIKMN